MGMGSRGQRPTTITDLIRATLVVIAAWGESDDEPASYKYDREIPWPVVATRPTMIHEEGRTARRPRVLTDERG